MIRQNGGGWLHRSKAIGKSTGRALRHTSTVMHHVLMAASGLLVVSCVLIAGAAWRLAQGPIDLGWLSDRVRAALVDDQSVADAGLGQVSFDGLVLAWEGFSKGVDYPLDFRISNIAVTDATGRQIVAATTAHITISLAGLVLGRFVPRAIEVDHARIAVTRDTSGAINLVSGADSGGSADAGSLGLRQIQEQLSRPAGTDHARGHGLLDQLQRAHFRDTEATVRDQASGLLVRTSGMDLEFVRRRTGHIAGTLRAPLVFSEQRADLAADLNFTPGLETSVEMRLSTFRPAGLAALAHAASFLAGVDVPISINAGIKLDAMFKPRDMQARIEFGEGKLDIANGSVPLLRGIAELSGTPDEVAIRKAHFELARGADGNPETVDFGGKVTHAADRLVAALTVGIDRIDVADLARFWPPGISEGARSWVVQHVTAGQATHGTVAAVVEADDALRDVVLARASGDLDVTNGVFTWLDDMPPVDHAEAHLHLVDPDTLDIQVATGRQRIRTGGADLLIRDGRMRISGLTARDQATVIRTQVDGPIASTLALLKEPRLRLLSVHPIALKIDAGDGSAALDFQFPLVNKLSIDDIQINAEAHLKHVRLLDVAGGHVFDEGSFDLRVDKDGLGFKGQGSLAAVPVTLDGTMDFNAGPADQIVQKIALSGQPDAAQLDAAGLRVTDVVRGTIPMTAVLTERRNGEGSLAINGDLTKAALAADLLAWSKPAGNAASATATLLMSHDRLTRIDRINVRGDGLLMTGSANFSDGLVRSVLVDSIRLGRTEGRGTIRLAPDQPIAIVLQGGQIDLSGKLTEKFSGDRTISPPVTTPGWTLDARFDRAILANGENAGNLLVTAMGDGATIRSLDLVGATRPEAGFSVKIAPETGKRHLHVDAKDAGAFLRGLDAVRVMRSGRLTIDANFENRFGYSPLAGTAVIDDVVVRNSPMLGKLLQAITLYGLVDVLRGPGMAFSHVVVPFQYDGVNLNIDQAHADNPSLGLTAKGSLGLSSGQASIGGTIVPAYFFNSMLGQLPLVGKLFSPETGGGVFAARFALTGPADDPSVSINPISALTPGFLREIFGIFDAAGGRAGSAASGDRSGNAASGER
jgi:hypothetical protein